MKIIIAGSISHAEKIIKVKKELEAQGHEVEIPEGAKSEFLRGRTKVSQEEKARDKIKHDLIRDYYRKIGQYDILLVVNEDKDGIENYIGGNTFLEMGFAHVLDKKIYLLNDIPDMPYTDELLAMQPVVLKGALSKVKK